MQQWFSVRTISIIALIIVSAGYALLSIASRLLSEGFEPLTQVYVRLGAAFVLAIILFWKHLRFNRFSKIPRNDWLALLLMGTIGYAIGIYFITLGVLSAKLLNVSVVFATVPFFVYLYSFFFLKKKVQLALIISVIVSIVGIWIVATNSFIPTLTNFGRGEFFVLLAAATMAWYFVARKKLSNYLNNREITVVVLGIAFTCAFVLAILNGESLTLSSFNSSRVLLGLAIGAGFNIIASYFENFAFEHLDAVLGSQLLLIENVFALVFGILFYGEFVTTPEAVGALITIGSVYYANRYLS